MLLQYATLDFVHSTPNSEQFNDIYYQPEHGQAEADHVFIDGNHLKARFSALSPHSQFTIGETGFGTGLNVLRASTHFLTYAPKNAQLNLISCEKYPIELSYLKRIHQNWELPDWWNALYQQYPANHPGHHLLRLHPRITLLLLMGDAVEQLQQTHAQVDAWFLDGFAPAKNPELWQPALYQQLARLSTENATLATFTAARIVKEGLIAAGFSITKTSGYGRKRDMITATLTTPFTHSPYWTDLPPALSTNHPIRIIGAGLAGASTARALAERGYQVTLYHSPQTHPAASQVPVAVPYLQPGTQDTPMRQFHLAAWHHTKRWFKRLPSHLLDNIPIHLTAKDARQKKRHQTVYAQQLLNLDEWEIDDNHTLILKGLGVIDTPELLKALYTHPSITLKIKSFTQLPNDDITTILATAWDLSLLPSAWHKQLRPLRGHATLFRATRPLPNHAFCAGHSILPYPNRHQGYIGSVYHPNNADLTLYPEDNAQLLHSLTQTLPEHPACYHQHFIGIRAATRDYLPLIGPFPTVDILYNDYMPWQKNAKASIFAAPQFSTPTTYIHAGLGSKGTLTAFLGADVIATMISGAPLPIASNLLPYLLPARTLIRNIIRNQISI
ncbi:tRNA (5-methylaminomethyl-2-thiouridine)(34)-methyltransferase MnmD [Suttonella ornithocola]|uniref:tRNA 5-methylaminomethyl-2-thiouridine biosynthesis bifunctional protein MnmC n=1 Tax=Suttonella ornithocola TaxID=279832 RepID=A0A380MZQ1_9GAMM|nr:tRNA (5-methylaminomethyl-2-thiouridine)(34)-methyltransferase MnmD [Suttonella ornithocola]SUO97506.1 tRNA 5-methylaminomethyl-2-thiouridine biosynthesis bifunctional protein MnmC [Suttonella ornithocola]